MTTTVNIPDLGEGVDSVDVVAVLVKIGDTISVDQPLIEVETEKATLEVPAPASGMSIPWSGPAKTPGRTSRDGPPGTV